MAALPLCVDALRQGNDHSAPVQTTRVAQWASLAALTTGDYTRGGGEEGGEEVELEDLEAALRLAGRHDQVSATCSTALGTARGENGRFQVFRANSPASPGPPGTKRVLCALWIVPRPATKEQICRHF